MKRRVPSVVVGIFALALSAQAQTSFWWTNSVDDAWSNPLAWTNSAPTAPGSNDFVLTFQNTAAVTSSNDLGAFTLNQLVFAGTNLTLNGGDLIFKTSTGSIVPQILQNSSGAIAINNNLILSNNLTFAGSGSGAVTVNGNISGPSALIKSSTGLLVLTNGANAYTGGTLVNAGTLQISASVNALRGVTTIDSNATLLLSLNNVTWNNNFLGTGRIKLQLSGGIKLANVNTYSGGATISNSYLTATTHHAIGYGTLTVTNNGRLRLDPGATGSATFSNALTLAGGDTTFGAIHSVQGSNVWGGTVNIVAGPDSRVNAAAGLALMFALRRRR
jgi:autotransporter-associated beta strand protein